MCARTHVACVHTIPHLAHAHQTGTVVGRRTTSFTFLAGSDFTRSNTDHLSTQPRPTGCSREDHPRCTPGAQAQPRGHRLSVLKSMPPATAQLGLDRPQLPQPPAEAGRVVGPQLHTSPPAGGLPRQPGARKAGPVGEGKLPKHSSQVHTLTLWGP